jgi:hypothetical protein
MRLKRAAECTGKWMIGYFDSGKYLQKENTSTLVMTY